MYFPMNGMRVVIQRGKANLLHLLFGEHGSGSRQRELPYMQQMHFRLVVGISCRCSNTSGMGNILSRKSNTSVVWSNRRIRGQLLQESEFTSFMALNIKFIFCSRQSKKRMTWKLLKLLCHPQGSGKTVITHNNKQ